MPGEHTPIEKQSSATLWCGIIFPPIFFAIFIALLCVSKPTDPGWKSVLSFVAVVLFCWVLPWMAAVPRLDELVKRREFPTYTRPWLRAAITTTILEIASAGGLVSVIIVARKLGLIAD
jgi:hypothetical protein